MQPGTPPPRTPRQPGHAPGSPHGADDASRIGAELAAVVAGARRRAVRDGDRQIDTAHLLHSLLETDPEARAACGGPQRIARLLGYLVQRSIGYGLRWQSTVEDSGAVPVLTETGTLSPLAASALEHASARAAGRGEPARGIDLLAALVADPDARAVEVLTAAGIGVPEVPSGTAGGAEAYDEGAGRDH
ncbi:MULTISPECIES: Clp protease N-terminal domain-containing protein [unclassified Streptomyces]|uniref:Clp protease N-terminal domain-containing protein n=1 Tax=unclassified Streptomyces TaxID=2593676 RepID=UPI0035A8D536